MSVIEEDLSRDVEAVPKGVYQDNDIFNEYSDTKRKILLLLVAGVTFILPLSDTIYLPSLPKIQTDLSTSYSVASLTVALYTIAIGILPLVWGPLADYIGRKKTAIISLIIFEASCIGCLLAPEIISLIVFRIIQGIGISAVLIVETSAITDTWTPEKRGLALGLGAVPLLVGPVIGPVIGGLIANRFGWRGTFVVLLVLGGIAILVCIFLLQETLPYFVFERKVKQEIPNATNPFPKPEFLAPWMPLKFYAIPSVLILSLGMGFCFTGFFVVMVILPEVLGAEYGLNEVNTGLCFLPIGVGAFIGSPLGGKLGDMVSQKLNSHAGALVVANVGLILMIPVLIANGWYMKDGDSLAGLLILTVFAGFCQSFAMPGIQSYAVRIVPNQAGAVIGLIQLVMFVFAGILIWASTALSSLMGYGWLFTAIAIIQVFSAAAVVGLTYKILREDKVI